LRARIQELEVQLDAAVAERAELQRVVEEGKERAARVPQLEAKLAEAERTRGALDRLRIVELESQLAEALHAAEVAREHVVAERELRNAEQAQHDARLQEIVTHLATDHEADLGQALEEKSAAKAEVRSLTMRLASLQKTADEERVAFAAEQDKWIAARQSLVAALQEADARAQQVADDGAALLAKVRAAAQGEIDALTTRVTELQREVLRRTPLSEDTRPGVTVPPEPTGFAIVQPALVPVRPRVLVAHPDAALRAAARDTLQRIGYEVETAADGLECLRIAIAVQPNVVIADATMPKMDGRELCQLLKSQPRTAGIKIILLTRSDEAPRPSRELQPDELLRKPVKFETLRSTLAQLAPV
jgi:CheY-like chemotaxis protein